MKISFVEVLFLVASISNVIIADKIAEFTVERFSSHLQWSSPDARHPRNTINENGLNINGPGTHTIWPDDTMWCSDWNAPIAKQFVVYDLGAVYNNDILKARIWNWNAADGSITAGVDEFEILVSQDDVAYTSLGTVNLAVAPMSADVNFSELFTFNPSDSFRYVKFDISSNHGYAGAVGLSEVCFYTGQSVPPTSIIDKLAHLVLYWLASDCTTWNEWCDETDMNKNTVVDFTDEVGILCLDDVTITRPNIDDAPRYNPRISSIGSKNLLQNSSFEFGDDNWSSLGIVTGWTGDLSGLFGEIQTGVSWDGNHCLRINMSPGAYPVTYADSWPPDQDTQYSPLAANIGWARVEQGEDYTLSAYMRSGAQNVRAKLMFRHSGTPPDGRITTESTTVTLSDQWQRYSFTSTASSDDLCVAVGPDMSNMPGSSVMFYLDAVQLEKSPSATSYTPREQLEIGVSTGKYGNIFDEAEPIQFNFVGRNTSANGVVVDITIQLEDYFGQCLPQEFLQMNIPGNGSTTTSWMVPVPGKGFYKAAISWQVNSVTHSRDLKFAVIETYAGSDSPFGVNHAPSTSGQCSLLLKVGVTWARNWAQNWQWIEPVQGQVSYNSVDVHIDRVLASGMNILSLLPSNPSTNWASEAPPEIPASKWYRLAYAPTNPQWLYDFISQTVNRYKDREKYWEFLNEPLWVPDFCLPTSAGYTVSDYITLLQGAYAAMKAADPNCKVIGGLSIQAEMTLGDDFINAGGLDYVDIYNLHPYPCFNTPESFIAHMERILTVMDNNGGRKPIWATECGYYAADDKPWTPYVAPTSGGGQWGLESERLCSDYLVRFSTIMLAHGVERIFWQQPIEGVVNNGYWNLSNCLLAENAVPRKAYAAQSTLANMVGSAPVYTEKMTFPSAIFGSDVDKLFGYAFQCDSRAVLIAWAYPEEINSFTLKLAQDVEVFNIMGNSVSQLESFGSSPVYLTTTSMTAENLANGWWQ